jgi:hypothetical protein
MTVCSQSWTVAVFGELDLRAVTVGCRVGARSVDAMWMFLRHGSLVRQGGRRNLGIDRKPRCEEWVMSEGSLSPASPPPRQSAAVEPPAQTPWPGVEQQRIARRMQALSTQLSISARRRSAAAGGGMGMTDDRR